MKGEKHDHWLDYAGDKYDKQFIEDTKRVLAVGFLFLPLPVFWALYDQQVINYLHFKHRKRKFSNFQPQKGITVDIPSNSDERRHRRRCCH